MMNKDYWLKKWQNQDTKFHSPTVTKYFQSHAVDALKALPQGSNVLFPLCGKTVDILAAADLGHKIFGVDLSEVALKSFFTENNLVIEKTATNTHVKIFTSQNINLICCDFFLSPIDEESIDFIFDRAAFIAIEKSLRPKYVAMLHRLLKKGGQILLNTYHFDQTKFDGPPFAVSEDQTSAFFNPHFTLATKFSEEAICDHEHLAAKGLSSLVSHVTMWRKN